MLQYKILSCFCGPVACCGDLSWLCYMVLWRVAAGSFGDLSLLYHTVLSSDQILATEGSYAQYPGNGNLCGSVLASVERHVLLCILHGHSGVFC